jgi:hypothetical protein
MPDDLPALDPENHPRAAAANDFHGGSLAGTEELQRDAKTESDVTTNPKCRWGWSGPRNEHRLEC